MLSPDNLVYWHYGWLKLNATIVNTWILMALLAGGAYVLGRLRHSPRWRGVPELIVTAISGQIAEVGLREPRRYLGFLGSLFLLIAVSNLGAVVPGYDPPTGSLSTTVALALCVLVAVPLFGIADAGLFGYLKTYAEPSAIMLPFNVVGELSRTLALAVRLFGNMMSGSMIVAILLTITPFIFPLVMTLLGLLTGIVQAYIFSVLAAVYIAAATRASESAPRSRLGSAPAH